MPLERFGLHIDHNPLPPGHAPPKTEAAMADYALRYNRAMLADPRFPYADICAQAKPRPQFTQNDIRQPDEWAGPPPAPPTSRPLSLGEAARHGTPASLDQWIARRADRLDEPDDFALTPLAWAVLHDRPEAVRSLLAAGADPYPTLCNHHPEAPALVLAMRLRRPYVIEMARAGGLGTRRPWPRRLMVIAVETDQVALVRLMLSQPNQAGDGPLHRRDEPLSPAMKRALDARSKD
ncbi:hypothetical protein GVN21_01600 [Caulobacter sp. SLTY]|uniref:hypothetical protein n=1 Tax=Caulobacter sp. SLTY TaxID=2683262 RepID=UPI0014126874|nr:hypothetical protein [Caulobacter sp. SLTY]NBB14046.1 hypothetical protein [Caulobacter sp. SLTY]